MKRILIIGNSPLPNENTKSRPAAGLRTYQFLKPLTEAGCIATDEEKAGARVDEPQFSIQLITIAMSECYEEEPRRQEIKHSENYSQFLISKNDPQLIQAIQQIHDQFHPDAIVSVNTYPSYIASQVKSQAPLWADLNGWIMAEGQAQARKADSNDYLPHYYEMEREILKWTDKLSAVSETQKFALLGELASFGRLNKESFGYEFAHHIPNGTEWFDGELEEAGESESMEILKNISEDNFVLLWMGGYNTWVDEITLFKGLEDAMKKCEKLYFVSTGGEIKGLDNQTFSRFKKMIDDSQYKDRFVFLGWVDTKDIPSIYGRADAGINVDRKCVETLTGARNRINEMMKFGLPVITTLGSEISYEVLRVEAGIAVRSGQHDLLTEAICSIYEQWHGGFERQSLRFKQYGKNGMEYIENECNYKTTLRPLLKWLENPRPAPDRNIDLKLGASSRFRGGLKYLKENGFKKSLRKFVQKIKS